MISLRTAETLTTSKEFQLIQRAQKDVSLSVNKLLIARARKYRNKYRDLSRRQALKNPEGKRVPVRTARKVKFFEKVLSELQDKLKIKQMAHRRINTKSARPQLKKRKPKTKKRI